ncbi:unnamed protein product [Caenorhabditis bovis]|uniref:Uncharacterized protein n=1 Tax=Caenorhabditis bovis TaxID=2654633 RepID=A0A8S1EV38_9PELO|nr:unnamed protein product [Caenorhabditis bovis]
MAIQFPHEKPFFEPFSVEDLQSLHFPPSPPTFEYRRENHVKMTERERLRLLRTIDEEAQFSRLPEPLDQFYGQQSADFPDGLFNDEFSDVEDEFYIGISPSLKAKKRNYKIPKKAGKMVVMPSQRRSSRKTAAKAKRILKNMAKNHQF